MVSSVDNVRQWSTQTMLKVMKQADQQQASGSGSGSGSLASRLLSDYGIDSTNDGLDSGTYSLINNLSAKTDQAAAAAPKQPDSITSEDFSKFLKQQLEEMKKAPGKAEQAAAMLAALKAGTLTVSDAAEGKSIRPADPAKVPTPETKATDLTSKDWGSFLRDHLARENGGQFTRNKDGSYVDRQTNEHAFYGSLGDKSYYLTWPSTEAK